jgi:hypothetical protein
MVGLGEFSFASGAVQLLETVLAALMELSVKMPVWIHTFDPLKLTDLKELAVFSQAIP